MNCLRSQLHTKCQCVQVRHTLITGETHSYYRCMYRRDTLLFEMQHYYLIQKRSYFRYSIIKSACVWVGGERGGGYVQATHTLILDTALLLDQEAWM